MSKCKRRGLLHNVSTHYDLKRLF